MIGSLTTSLDVRSMTVSSDLTYLGGKGGMVEIWSREKHNKIDTLQMGRNCKIVCMALDEREEVLVIGTSDGRIQVENTFYFGWTYIFISDMLTT